MVPTEAKPLSGILLPRSSSVRYCCFGTVVGSEDVMPVVGELVNGGVLRVIPSPSVE